MSKIIGLVFPKENPPKGENKKENPPKEKNNK